MTYPAELYRAFFEAVNEPIFAVDAATGTVLTANASAIRNSGLPREAVVGQSVERVFQAQNGLGLPFFLENCAGASRSGCNRVQMRTSGGKSLAVTVSVAKVAWDGAEILFLAAREADVDGPGTCPVADLADIAWSEPEEFPTIIGQSEKIREVCRLIGAVAKSDVTVLIQGESGTGKEVIANAIHVHSHRRQAPFVKVNCAALSETLLESELFGHVKGAFTGAIRDRCGRFKQADGGTILLDEIGSMSLSGQAKLLRVLQEQEFEPVGSSLTTSVNVRVIAATNVDLARAASEGRFRDDLYYRLNVFAIPLPPLRERKEDILLLAGHLLSRYSRALGKRIDAIAPETFAALIEYDWPGNVRELENAIEHAVIVEKGALVLPSSLPMNLVPARRAESGGEHPGEMGLREKLTLLERQILLETLFKAKGVKKHAADMLGIDARNLPYLLKKHRLAPDVNGNASCGDSSSASLPGSGERAGEAGSAGRARRSCGAPLFRPLRAVPPYKSPL